MSQLAHSRESTETTEPSLKRAMGPWLLLLFIIGDLLGTGIYALTGQVAAHVGGVVWLPFLLAVVVAVFTALSYLELVTKYPRAAGAALYVQKAFGVPFVTFLVGFAVMCSGITSASTASRAFAANFADALAPSLSSTIGVTLVALVFMAAIAAINCRGVAHSLGANVLLTLVELSGLLIIIAIGFWAIGHGEGDVGRVVEFRTDKSGGWVLPVITATTLAFFAMVGFEDSVNMVEESTHPRIFPRALLVALRVTAVIYVWCPSPPLRWFRPSSSRKGTVLLKAADALEPTEPHKAQKLRRASTHWLRHTAVTHQADAGIELRYLNRSARHANLETTKIYLHADDDAWHEAMEQHKLQKRS